MMRPVLTAAAVAVFVGAALSGVGAQQSSTAVAASNLSAPPTLRCRPSTPRSLTACAIFLPPGEKLNPSKIVADRVRWETDPETYGPDGANAVVYVKEKSDVVDIESNIYLMTDAPDGVYRVLVVADRNAPTFSEVHFRHELSPVLQRAAAADASSRARAAAAAAAADREVVRRETVAAQQRAAAADASRATLADLDDHPCTVRNNAAKYHWDEKSPFAPVAVFTDDELHTCIQFSNLTMSLPLPYVGDAPARVHPLRRHDDMMIVDGLQGYFTLRSGSNSLQISYQK